MQKKYWLVFWVLAILLLFFNNGNLLITDSVESNYALTAKEMVLSGDWMSPQIYGRYWYDKPIMFYWLTALGFKLFGFTEFGARFFPGVFGLLALGLICYAGKRLYNERTGFISGVMLLTSVEFFLISKSIITDSVLFFFFSATLLFFYLGYRENKAVDWYLMYISAAMAVLTKGPIGTLLPGLIITLFLLWQRDWHVLKRCRLISGLLLYALVALPWYIGMYQIHGSDFIGTFFGTHNFLRATVSEHPRDNVIYYYTMVNALALFPWVGLIPWIVYKRYKERNFKLAERERFLLLWAAVVFFFFQCMATKYITYTYPLLFPAVLIFAHIADKYGNECFNNKYKFFVGGFIALLLIVAWVLVVKGKLVTDTLFLLPLSVIVGIMLYYGLYLYTEKYVYGISVFCLVFYLALIQSIALPLTEKRSAKDLGELLYKKQVAEIALYGKYPTSAVFYSKAKIVYLIHNKDVAKYVPKSYSWSSKNVMPYTTLEKNPYHCVVVRDDKLEGFLRQEKVRFKVSENDGRWIILTR